MALNKLTRTPRRPKSGDLDAQPRSENGAGFLLATAPLSWTSLKFDQAIQFRGPSVKLVGECEKLAIGLMTS